MTGPTLAELVARHGLRCQGREWRGTCPSCGYPGAPSVRTGDAGRLLAWCASCQDGHAVMRALGAAPMQRCDRIPDATRADLQARRSDLALRLWRRAIPVLGTPAERYLAVRHVAHAARCSDLAFLPDCPNPTGATIGALVALVRNGAGEPVAIHRTFLRHDGCGKASIDSARASLGPVWSGAIRLASPAPELVIGEGLETAAAAGLLAGLPAWAAISAGNLARGLALPAEVRSVVITVDRDQPGERAATEAARRWRAEGRTVRLLMPHVAGQDAADVLGAREAGHA